MKLFANYAKISFCRIQWTADEWINNYSCPTRQEKGQVAKGLTPGKYMLQYIVKKMLKNKKLVNCPIQDELYMNIIREHSWQEICANESPNLPSEEVEPIRQRENSDLAWNRLSNGNVRWIHVVLAEEGLDLILK